MSCFCCFSFFFFFLGLLREATAVVGGALVASCSRRLLGLALGERLRLRLRVWLLGILPALTPAFFCLSFLLLAPLAVEALALPGADCLRQKRTLPVQNRPQTVEVILKMTGFTLTCLIAARCCWLMPRWIVARESQAAPSGSSSAHPHACRGSPECSAIPSVPASRAHPAPCHHAATPQKHTSRNQAH